MYLTLSICFSPVFPYFLLDIEKWLPVNIKKFYLVSSDPQLKYYTILYEFHK